MDSKYSIIIKSCIGELTLHQINENRQQYATYRVFRGNEDVTDRYEVVFDTIDTQLSYCPIRVDQRPIELTANSVVREYNGSPVQSTGYTISMGSLVAGHRIVFIEIDGSITEVGITECVVIDRSIKIVDQQNRNVTSNYQISTKPGVLEVIDPDEKDRM